MVKRTYEKGIKILRIPTVGQKEVAEVRRNWDTLSEAKKFLTQVGITEDNEPEAIREGLLADISGNEYSVLYTRWLGWSTFLKQRLTEVNAVMLQLSNESKDFEVRIRAELQGKTTAQEKADQVWRHPEYNRLQIEIQLQTQIRDFISVKVTAADASLRMISRQIEIRKTELAGQVREGNLGRGFS